MSQPSWLSSLKSHGGYFLRVSAKQFHMVRDDPSLPTPHFSVELYVNVAFSSENGRLLLPVEALSLWQTLRFPCHDLISDDGEPTASSRAVVSKIISKTGFSVPSPPPNNVHWKRQLVGEEDASAAWISGDEDRLVEMVLEFMGCMRIAPYNARRKVLALSLTIDKYVTLPEQEFEDLVCWYEWQKRTRVGYSTA